jgi:tRNA-dihydrouridine synthase
MKLPYPSSHDFALILAPMAGVSEAPFRQICRRMGADLVVSEFLSSEAIRRRIKTTLEGAEFEEVERPIGIQIYGADPNAMAEAAGLITEHYRPEFIDINFGCPVKKVVQRNGGSGCLRDMDLVQRIIRAVIAATHLPVTVKTRSGAQNAGRRRSCVHPACSYPNPDVFGEGRLGRDRPSGGSVGDSGDRQW